MGLESGSKRKSPEQGDLFDDVDSLKKFTDKSSPEFKERLVDLVVNAIERQEKEDIVSDSAYIYMEKLFTRIELSKILSAQELNDMRTAVASAATNKLIDREIQDK